MYLVTVRKLTYYSAGFLLKFSHSDTAIGCFFLPTHSFSVLESRCNQVKRTLGTWGFFSKESSISFLYSYWCLQETSGSASGAFLFPGIGMAY